MVVAIKQIVLIIKIIKITTTMSNGKDIPCPFNKFEHAKCK